MTSRHSGLLQAALLRAAVLALCWWAITEGDRGALAMGVPVVILAAGVSLQMHPPQTFSLWGFFRFIPSFLWRSLSGGVDVARRALSPAMPIEPSLIEYRTRLPAGLPRVVLANVVSLLPGTLSADLEEDLLSLHVLSKAAGDEGDLRQLERTIARIFA